MTNNPRIVSPDMTAYIQNRKRDIKSEINCISIGTIDSFNATEQTVNIRLNFLRVIVGGAPSNSPDNDQTNDKTLSYPLLVKCPVMILTGGSGHLTMPITEGDTCIVLFCDRDIDAWWSTGNVVAPNSQRIHDLNDGIAIVGIRSMANALAIYNQLGPELSNGDGSALVAVEDKIKIQVGLITLRVALDALMTALLTWVDTNGDTPNPATVLLLEAAQTAIDGVLK